MNIKFLLPKARGFIEKGKIPRRASQRFRGLVPLTTYVTDRWLH